MTHQTSSVYKALLTSPKRNNRMGGVGESAVKHRPLRIRMGRERRGRAMFQNMTHLSLDLEMIRGGGGAHWALM